MGESDPKALVIDQDLACAGCGYNLRTLDVAGLCPECGMPVRESIAGDYLAGADRAWVRQMRGATFWLLTGAALAAIAVLLTIGLDDPANPTNPARWIIATALGRMLGPFLELLGVIRLVTLEPSLKNRPRERFLGDLLGLSTVGWAALMPVWCMDLSSTCLATVPLFIGVPRWILLYHFLAALTRRLPREGMAAEATWLGILGAAVHAIAAAVMIAHPLIAAGSVVSLVRLGLFGWSVIFLLRLHRALTGVLKLPPVPDALAALVRVRAFEKGAETRPAKEH